MLINMAAVSARHFQTTCTLLRTRPNTRRPRHPSWNRQQLIELSKPQHSLKHPTTQFLYQDCPRHQEIIEQVGTQQTGRRFRFVQERSIIPFPCFDTGGAQCAQRLRDDLRARDAGFPREEQDGRRLPGASQVQVEVAHRLAERAQVREFLDLN